MLFDDKNSFFERARASSVSMKSGITLMVKGFVVASVIGVCLALREYSKES